MHRLNKLDTDVELELLHQRSAINSINNNNNTMGYQCDSYSTSPSKDFHHHQKDHQQNSHQDTDDSFMRPPLWEDITSSIQNIDPENAIMLNALTGATQVKLESCDETTFLESLSSPLLSPLEIKTEKDFYHQQIQQLPPPTSHNMTNGTTDYHQQYHHQQINGYQATDFNLQQQYSNNYYNHNWQQPQHHQQQQQQSQSHQTTIYNNNNNNNNNNKYPPTQSTNFSAPISRLMYVPPLTPPSSDPGSPGNSIQVSFHYISNRIE